MNTILDEIQKFIRKITRKFGVDVVRFVYTELTQNEKEIYDKISPYTMTSIERVISIFNSIDYLTKYKIPGAIVECGVWRGGSMMAAALKLIENNDTSRDLYLFDTYEGMSEPTKDDVAYSGLSATKEFLRVRTGKDSSAWCDASLEEVQKAIWSTGYPKEKIHFIKGKVEDTLEANPPKYEVALLRVDTDWYESTIKCLESMYSNISKSGVLIMDDYGFWQGAKKAADQYFSKTKDRIFLHRIDHTGRIVIKQ